jgi:DNA invertase Pin-like site-specific DNA recombinase
VPGGLAEFDRDRIRTREGCERAKARGVKLGRKPKLTEHQKPEAIRRRDRDSEPVREIARSYNVSHNTFRGSHCETKLRSATRSRQA